MSELIELTSYTLEWWDEYDEKEYGDIFFNPETQEVVIDGNSISISLTLFQLDTFISALTTAKEKAEKYATQH